MSKKMSRYPSDRKVYVGDLGNNARKNELEYAFSNYGTLRSVWIARNPPGFAFVEFEDSRDASDAVRGLDGRTVCGRRARVELSTGKYASSRSERRGSRSRGRPFHPDDKCYECGGRGHYARDCRRYGRRRRSHSRSQTRSRSYSRDNRTRSRTGSRSKSGSRSRSRSVSKDSREPREDRKVRDARRSKENGHKNGDSHYSDDDRQISRSPQRARYHKSRSPIRSNSRHEREESKSSKKSRSISLRQRDSRSRSISCSRSRSR